MNRKVPKPPDCVDQALDLGDRHLRGADDGEARLHQGVDQLVGVGRARGQRQGGHPSK